MVRTKFLFHAFSVFGPKQVIDFFNGLGVKTKIENNNRVFPISEKAEDVLNALKKYLLKNKVNISLDTCVSKIIFKDNFSSRKASERRRKIEKLIVGDPSADSLRHGSGRAGQAKEIIAKKYIFCTGGKSYPITGSTGDGLRWASDLGHSIGEFSPALVPIKLKENWIKDLQGLALKDVKISICQNLTKENKKHFQETGDILFTHFGLSGPAILNMSKRIGELLKKGHAYRQAGHAYRQTGHAYRQTGLPADQAGEVKLCLDFFPNLNIEDLDKKIQEKINKNPKKSIKNFFADFMPQRFIPIFIKNLGIEADKQINNITKIERRNIAKILKNFEVVATGLLGFDLAMTTSGGVLLKEIDDKTMKSKIIDNLFFAGEIINIDGRTGGFNLQACWSTGYLAGKSVIK